MAPTTPFNTGLATTMTLNGIATIDSGETATLAIPNSGRAVVRLAFPSAFTGTTVTFTAQAYPASGALAAATFKTVVDKDGDAVSYTIGASKIVEVPELSGVAAFTIVSGSAEGAARSIEVACRGDNPTAVPTKLEASGTVTVATVTAATSNAFGSLATTTRAANQTPYAANDVVGAAFDLGVMGPSASRIVLQSTIFRPRITAVPAGMANFRLALYNVTPPSALADNAPWTIPAGDQASFLGIISLGTPALPAASSVDLYIDRYNIGMELLLAGTHLFAYLVTDAAFTPAANSEVYALDAKTVAL